MLVGPRLHRHNNENDMQSKFYFISKLFLKKWGDREKNKKTYTVYKLCTPYTAGWFR